MTDERDKHILNAARDCYLRFGVDKTGMADIANESGVSRATIYRRFAGVDEIFMAVLVSESESLAVDCQKYLAQYTSPSDLIIEGMLFCLKEVPLRPLHAHFFQSESQTWAALRAMPAEPLHDVTTMILRENLGINTVPAHTDSNAIGHLAELILRLLISYATNPSHRARSTDDMREMLHANIDPIVQALVREAPEHPGKQISNSITQKAGNS